MMNEDFFLEKLAQKLFDKGSDNILNTTIVLPNQRAKVFLIEAIKKRALKNMFVPKIVSIEEYVQDLSNLVVVDNIELLFEFYNVYQEITSSEEIETFDKFANWAKILIQDFNEINRYLLDSTKVFNYLTDVEVLKRWHLDANETTQMIKNSLTFWAKIPEYYQAFTKHLLSKKIGYQGLIYKQAVANLSSTITTTKDNSIIFAGFNALNQAEEIIFQRMLEANKAFVFWDIDEYFLKDHFHDAGLFIRRFYKKWSYYKNNPDLFTWVVNEFSKEKNIKIIGTPKSVGQAKIAGNIIEEIQSKDKSLNNVALILGQEGLLLPVLNALPNSVDALNITMGYGAQNNPAQLLIQKIFELHLHALNRKNNEFYYKDLLAVITHPYVDVYIDGAAVANEIYNDNLTFISPNKAISLFSKDIQFVELILKPWQAPVHVILQRILGVLLKVKSGLNIDNKNDLLAQTFVYAIYKVVTKIVTYQEKHNLIQSASMLFAIYKQAIELAEVSFEGEPLKGLQIIGVLESRVLDFETVIITSLNEGVFPAGKSNHSFIPNDIKLQLGLPTFKEKDAIYTYHFYHALLRAKNVYLLYNTEPAEGIDKGEKSRFITQLLLEKQENHIVEQLNYTAFLPEKAKSEIIIEKTPLLQQRLKTIATIKGFSPSSIGTYLRSPLGFYKQRVLGIRDVDEVEENIAANTLGTIIHNVLEELYKPYIGVFLSEKILETLLKNYKNEVKKQFELVYKKGEIAKGKNLIAYKVAEKYISDFLKLEKRNIEAGDSIKIIDLEGEQEIQIESPLLPYVVKIAGKVDRIEMRNGVYRIIDYKSGTVLPADVKIKNWNDLIKNDKKTKAIQLLCYALMTYQKIKSNAIEVGLISFKNINSGFIAFEESNLKETQITEEVVERFKEQLIDLLQEILNPEIPFSEKR